MVCNKLVMSWTSRSYKSTMQSATIFAFGWIWSKLGQKIESVQNHRNQAKYDHSLILTLGIVKMCLVMCPLIDLGFMHRFELIPEKCNSDLSGVANVIFKPTAECNATGAHEWPSLSNGTILTCRNADD